MLKIVDFPAFGMPTIPTFFNHHTPKVDFNSLEYPMRRMKDGEFDLKIQEKRYAEIFIES